MLLPVDLREWVPEEDMVHFVLEGNGLSSVPAAWAAKGNRRMAVGNARLQYEATLELETGMYLSKRGTFARD